MANHRKPEHLKRKIRALRLNDLELADLDRAQALLGETSRNDAIVRLVREALADLGAADFSGSSSEAQASPSSREDPMASNRPGGVCLAGSGRSGAGC